MAQIVIVEPGDILLIGSQADFDVEREAPLLERLKALLAVSLIVVMEGPVDLGIVRRRLIEGGADAVAGA